MSPQDIRAIIEGSSPVGRRPRRRLHLAAAAAALILLVALAAYAAAPPNVDTFALTQSSISATGSGNTASGVIAEGSEDGILGKEREVHLAITAGPGTVLVAFSGGNVSISTPVDTNATTTLTYDGTTDSDPAPSSVDVSGLCSGGVCKDLTQGGNTNGFRLVIPQDDTLGNLTVTVWKGNGGSPGGSCTLTANNFFPGGWPLGPSRTMFLEFPRILGGSCTGDTTDLFKNVGAVQFRISGGALDISLDQIDVDAVFDWGDLPETDCSGLYATKDACKGPHHLVVANFGLGAEIDPGGTYDGELDGQPSINADGDDTGLSKADEEGVKPVNLPWQDGAGGGALQITVRGAGRLVGWIDWDGDGITHTDMVVNASVSTGTATYLVAVPAGFMPTTGSKDVYARFRLFPANEIPGPFLSYAYDGRDTEGVFDGFFPPPDRSLGGEVEDYRWWLKPTAVSLAALNVSVQGQAVEVSWDTASEIDNAGFNLYRSTSEDGPGTRLNANLIPAQAPGSPAGFHYAYLDSAGLAPGATYWYTLEDISASGVATRHEPVSVLYGAGPNAVSLSGFRAAAALPAVPLAALAPVAGLLLAAGALRRRGAPR